MNRNESLQANQLEKKVWHDLDTLDALASHGLSLFPCRPDKSPVYGRGAEPWGSSAPSQYRTTHALARAEILGWWPGQVELVVVDVDVTKSAPAHQRAFEATCRRAYVETELGAPLFAVTTPSGGWHLGYRATALTAADTANGDWFGPEGKPAGTWGDIRGANGYCCLYDAAALRTCLDTLHAAREVDPDTWRVFRSPSSPSPDAGAGASPSALAELGGHDPIGEICNAPDGSRNNTISRAAASAGRLGFHTVDAVVAAARARCPDEPDTAERTARAQYAWGVAQAVSAKAAGGEGEAARAKAAPDEEAARNQGAGVPGGLGSLRKPWVNKGMAGAKFDRGRLVASKSAVGLRDALDYLMLEARREVRYKQVQFRGPNLDVADAHGIVPATRDGWWTSDNPMTAHVRALIERHCCWAVKDAHGKTVFRPLKWSNAEWGLTLDAILHHKRADSFRQNLEGLESWDDVPRLDQWLSEVFYVAKDEDPELVAWASRVVPLTAVTRTYEPGYKVDETLVLIGPQGAGKSTVFRHLLPEVERAHWFTDGVRFDAPEQKIVEAIKGRVICEFGEAAGLTKADLGRLKTFLTRVDDGSIRLTWRPDPEIMLRMAAFVITTDRADCLPDDASGNRRFASVRLDLDRHCGRVPAEEYMEKWARQIWAEALARYRKGERPNLPRELAEVQAEANERVRSADTALEDAILASFPYGVRRPGLTLEDIAHLTDFTIQRSQKDKGSGIVTFWKPLNSLAKREQHRITDALRAVQCVSGGRWRRTEHKMRLNGTCLAYRWFVDESDEPPDEYATEAQRRRNTYQRGAGSHG